MQLYLEGGTWFKKKSPLEKISFLVDWPLSERIIKYRQASWPEDDVKPLRPFFIHLCEAPDFDKGQDCWPPCDSVFIPICNKRYISKPQNKEMGSVSGKTDSPVSSFLSPSGWIPIWSVGARHVYLLALAFKFHARSSPRRGTFRYSSGTGGPT